MSVHRRRALRESAHYPPEGTVARGQLSCLSRPLQREQIELNTPGTSRLQAEFQKKDRKRRNRGHSPRSVARALAQSTARFWPIAKARVTADGVALPRAEVLCFLDHEHQVSRPLPLFVFGELVEQDSAQVSDHELLRRKVHPRRPVRAEVEDRHPALRQVFDSRVD